MVLCAAQPHRWPGLSKYKLLIIQTACHFSSSAWLEYDLAFRKDAAASGLSYSSKMNLDLYNFHLRSPTLASPPLPRCSFPMTPAWSPLFAIHGTTGSAVGPLAAANIDTTAVTVKVNTPRSTVHFPTPLVHDLSLPNPGGKGDGTEWAVMPSEACVHNVNSSVASPGGQCDLLSSVKSCRSVICPFSIPSVAVSFHSFSSLAPASQVSLLWLDQF